MEPDDEVFESSTLVACPYCGETIEVLIDLGGGPRQDYVEDCEVCCRPWQVSVRYEAGVPNVSVTRAD